MGKPVCSYYTTSTAQETKKNRIKHDFYKNVNVGWKLKHVFESCKHSLNELYVKNDIWYLNNLLLCNITEVSYSAKHIARLEIENLLKH